MGGKTCNLFILKKLSLNKLTSICYLEGFMLVWLHALPFTTVLFSFSHVVVVQSLSCISFFVTPWTAVHQALLSSTISHCLLKFMSIESVMPSNHLIFCHPLLFLPSTFPSIGVFSNELVLCIRWPKCSNFSHQSLQWIFRVDFF